MIPSSDKPLNSGLYVISVPIGNLGDITLRALETFRKLDKIYCEDTRVTKKLLDLYHISAPELIRCDDAVQAGLIEKIITDIHNNLAIGLVSDAGTPLISDPGYEIMTALRQKNLPIFSVPGVCAAITALSVSGLPTDRFRFMGFVPKKDKQRQELIALMMSHKDTFIFYERPDRILKFLSLFPQTLLEATCGIAREITKLHEEYHSGTIKEILEILPSLCLKGEAVLMIATHKLEVQTNIDLENEITALLHQGYSPKDISQDPKLRHYASRNDLYAQAQALKQALNNAPE